MKKSAIITLLAGVLLFPADDILAQFRSDNSSDFERTGHIRTTHSEGNSSLFGLQDFEMSHSYEMTMGSFGGDMFNRNTYTNTMQMMFSDNLHGRVDLAMSHSPFGSNVMGQNNEAQFYVRNAELNYKFSENTRIQLRFQQVPAGQGYYGYHPHHHRRNHFHDPFRRW